MKIRSWGDAFLTWAATWKTCILEQGWEYAFPPLMAWNIVATCQLPHLPPVPLQCTENSGPAATTGWKKHQWNYVRPMEFRSNLWQNLTSYVPFSWVSSYIFFKQFLDVLHDSSIPSIDITWLVEKIYRKPKFSPWNSSGVPVNVTWNQSNNDKGFQLD